MAQEFKLKGIYNSDGLIRIGLKDIQLKTDKTNTLTLRNYNNTSYANLDINNLIVRGNLNASIPIDTTNFNCNLSSNDNTVQKALETLDEVLTGTELVPYYSSFTATVDNTTNCPINSVMYNPNNCKLDVFYQGSKLILNENYTLNADETSIDLTFSLQTNEKINYEILKNVVSSSLSTINGSQIDNNSISTSKLAFGNATINEDGLMSKEYAIQLEELSGTSLTSISDSLRKIRCGGLA